MAERCRPHSAKRYAALLPSLSSFVFFDTELWLQNSVTYLCSNFTKGQNGHTWDHHRLSNAVCFFARWPYVLSLAHIFKTASWHRQPLRQISTLYSADNYSASANNMKLVHWPLMGGLLHLVQRGGDWRGRSRPSLLFAVPDVTAHPSTASVPITVLHCAMIHCSALLKCPLKG